MCMCVWYMCMLVLCLCMYVCVLLTVLHEVLLVLNSSWKTLLAKETWEDLRRRRKGEEALLLWVLGPDLVDF